MSRIKWDDRLTTGNDVIDNQHKEIVGIATKLEDLSQFIAEEQNQGKELSAETRKTVLDIFEDLMRYSKDHFSHEEKLMDETEYPDKEEHRSKHQYFIREVQQLEKLFGTDEPEGIHQLAKFVFSWWQHHIFAFDGKLIPFIRKEK